VTLQTHIPDHDRFLEACGRHHVARADAEELWRDLAGLEPGGPPPPAQHLSRTAMATIIAGAVVLSAAGIWWLSLVGSVAGAPGVLALALAWVAAGTAAAELAARRPAAYLDAACAAVAVAYVPVAVGAVELGLLNWREDRWPVRMPVEIGFLAAGCLAAWRYRRPLLSMAAPTLGAGVVLLDMLVAAAGGWGTDMGRWPAWTGPVAVAAAAALAAGPAALDRRAARDWALWPAALADAAMLLAAVVLAVASFGAGSVGVGTAVGLAGLAVLGRGVMAGRLAGIGVGSLSFWVGTIVLGSHWGNLVVACLTSVAGVSLIVGAVVLSRRIGAIEGRRSAIGRESSA